MLALDLSIPALAVRGGMGGAVAPPVTALSAIDARGWSAQYSGTPPAFTPDTSPQTVTLNRPGYNSAGSPAMLTEALVLTQRVRQPWPNNATPTAATVALSDYVYSTDTISGVTNNSAEVSPKPIVQWVTPARAVVGNSIGGATNPIELIAFHRNARGGRQVAAVKFLVSDGTTTLSATVAATIVSARTGDRNAVLVYRMPAIDITALNAGLLTVNAEVYPWVGGAASVAKSADSSVAREFSPRLFLKNVGLAANPPYAYVAKAADGGAGIGTPSFSGTVSTTLATAKAAPFDTVQNALTAIHAAYGSTTGVDGCIIMLGDDGGTPHVLTSSTVARTQKIAALTITFDPLRARTACRASFGAAAFRPQLGSLLSGVSEAAIRFDCDIVRTGTATLQGEAAAPLQLIFDNSLTFDNASNSATFLANSHAYHLGTAFLNVSGSATIGPAANEHRLFRGISLQPASVAAGVTLEGWSVIGSAIRNPQFQFGARLAGGGVVAFNTLTDPPTSSIMLQLGQAAGSAPSADVNGFAFVQNMVEYISATGNAVLRISGDSATGNNSHVVVHHNSHAGAHLCGRWNAFYDEGATPRTSKLMSVVGNLGVAFFTKSDVFRGVNESGADASSRTGSWAFLYGVGCQGNFTQFQSADPIGGTQAQAYPGARSRIGTSKLSRKDPQFAAYAGTVTTGSSETAPAYAAGSGGGVYTLGSASPARGLVANGVLSHGLAGTARAAADDTAGAYA